MFKGVLQGFPMITRLHEVLQGFREPLLISKRRCRWLKYQTKSVERDRSHFHKEVL